MDYQGRYRPLAAITFVGSLLYSSGWANDSAKFSLPLDCTGDFKCFVQNMVDLRPGPEKSDPFCGAATFNGHKGTDFRVKDIPTMKHGIPVLAMADGVVIATRDGVDDKMVETKADREAVNMRECGNGVVTKHLMSDGKVWTAQTCHLAKGSVRVKKGDHIKRGQPIALMGLSGATQFPHVHVSFKQRKVIFDPITGISSGNECQADKALTKNSPLFRGRALEQIRGMDTSLLDSGFAGEPVKGAMLSKGQFKKPVQSGPLVFFAKMINLQKGDQIRLTITGPSGLFADNMTKPLDRSKATYTAFAGKKGKLKPGTYSGKADLIRAGKTIFSGGEQSISF